MEPYFGGGSVLFANDPTGISEVVNDLNSELFDFWRCLQNQREFAEFARIVQAIPFSQDEWRAAIGNGEFVGGRVARAVAFFVKNRQSLAGRMDSFAPLSRNRTRRGMNEAASAWLSAVEGLPAVHARLKRVVVLCDDGVKVIRQQDGVRTLNYIDPTYLPETRYAGGGEYKHEMTPEQHEELLDTLGGIKGRFILSGYPSKMYDSYATRFGWRCERIQIDNKASGRKTKEKKTECLWYNY